MDYYIDTEFALIIQHDGYILNPAAWNESFFKYDYIGAPYVNNGKLIVGNGGFSLRSKKLIRLLSKDNNICVDDKYKTGCYFKNSTLRYCHENEDQIISQIMRSHLERNGISFAPINLARQFAIEGNHMAGKKWTRQFGFHGFHTIAGVACR
jgi:Protein of unknown function (DUF5672)